MVYMVVPLFSVFLLFFYFSFMSFSFNFSYFSLDLIFDEVSLFMVYLTCFVVFISFLYGMLYLSLNLNCVLLSMLLVCCLVFSSSNFISFYFFYESSLIPILYIIMKWGSYPERSISSIMLLLYTSLFTFPFLYVLFCLYNSYSTMLFIFYPSSCVDIGGTSSSLFFSFIVFLAFAVKLPIYGLHFWLPMAHVEAPTFGSMILAGILLKLGGVGLIRFSLVCDFLLLKYYVMGYFLVFLCYVTFVCCFQSDFKRLVAYSSVSHMMTVPIMLFSSSFLGFKGLLSVMFLHGLSSPLLFMLVGVLYSIFFTRQNVLMRGLLCLSPLLSFIMVLSFFFTLSAPPFPSFFSEVMFSVSSISLWSFSFLFIVIFLFLSIVYNLLWLSSIVFFNQDSSVNYIYFFSYLFFMPMVTSLFFMPMVFSVLFYFVF